MCGCVVVCFSVTGVSMLTERGEWRGEREGGKGGEGDIVHI